VPPGEQATVGGHVIPGGLLHIGRHLGEPSLINPDLSVAAVPGHIVVPGDGPGLAYHLLSPAARRAYLDWLAGGRRADVPSGLVMLFCFGLERRLLLDDQAELAIVSEQLLEIALLRLEQTFAGAPA
jgi:hypothetical protein